MGHNTFGTINALMIMKVDETRVGAKFVKIE